MEFRLQGQSNDNWTRRVVFHSFPDSGNDVPLRVVHHNKTGCRWQSWVIRDRGYRSPASLNVRFARKATVRPKDAIRVGLMGSCPSRYVHFASQRIDAVCHYSAAHLYRVPEIVTRGRFPDGGESDSTWRTQEARHVGCDTIAPGF